MYKITFCFSLKNRIAIKQPNGKEKINGVKNAMPKSPKRFLTLIINLFVFVNIFFCLTTTFFSIRLRFNF